ncbi:hypothetical protein B0H21DRAFT_258781 [Amylocystis lapponica]|nr:hypothetical protein B0H21DRAFT_258781 [Amylocystis lapponica]
MRSSLFAAFLAVLTIFATSASASVLPNDNAIKARSPAPSPLARRAPAPSPLARRAPAPSAAKRHDARAPAPSAARRSIREQEPISSSHISQQLCPAPMSVCPIAGSSAPIPASLEAWLADGFQCADFSADLDSCGGCGSTDAQYDCTAIPGALGVSCLVGSCRVDSCKPGFSLTPDAKSCVPL